MTASEVGFNRPMPWRTPDHRRRRLGFRDWRCGGYCHGAGELARSTLRFHQKLSERLSCPDQLVGLDQAARSELGNATESQRVGIRLGVAQEIQDSQIYSAHRGWRRTGT